MQRVYLLAHAYRINGCLNSRLPLQLIIQARWLEPNGWRPGREKRGLYSANSRSNDNYTLRPAAAAFLYISVSFAGGREGPLNLPLFICQRFAASIRRYFYSQSLTVVMCSRICPTFPDIYRSDFALSPIHQLMLLRAAASDKLILGLLWHTFCSFSEIFCLFIIAIFAYSSNKVSNNNKKKRCF